MARYEEVTIAWHDDKAEVHNVLVSIDAMWNSIDDEDDVDIFYYFASEEEFEEAKQEDNDYEFRIIEENN